MALSVAPSLGPSERAGAEGPVSSRGAALFTFYLRVGSVRGRSPHCPVTDAVDRESPTLLGSFLPGSRALRPRLTLGGDARS